MKQNNKLKFFKSKIDYIVLVVFTLIFGIFAAANVFFKIDSRLYDMMLGTRKSPAADQNICFVEVDDNSINLVGPWPWTRDVLGDSLLRMKELGAKTAVFDIEYISASNKGVDEDGLNKFNQAFSQGQQDIIGQVQKFSDGVTSGDITQTNASSLSDTLIQNTIIPDLNMMFDSVNSSSLRDNDDYFARCVQLFGNTWLTVNTENIFTVDEQAVEQAKKRFLFDNLTDPKKLVEKTNGQVFYENGSEKAFIPPYEPIARRASGAGFTNVYIDRDGTRRRIELLEDYDGRYAAQLALAPLLKAMDVQQVERKNRSIVLKGALLPGKDSRTDINIPLDEKGFMLINWQHSNFADSFKHSYVYFLRCLDLDEQDMAAFLQEFSQLDSARGTSYAKLSGELYAEYVNLFQFKQYLLDACEGYDDDGNALNGGVNESDCQQYFEQHRAFIEKVAEFASVENKEAALKQIDALASGKNASYYTSLGEAVNYYFEEILKAVSDYNQIYSAQSSILKDSFCIIGDTATSTTDMGVTPFYKGYPNVGTHANVINTILQRNFIRSENVFWGMALAFLSALLVLFLSRNLSAGKRSSCGLVYVVVTAGAIVLLMTFAGIYIPLFCPMMTTIFTAITVTVIHFFTAEKQKKELKTAFGTYLAPEVVDIISKDPTKLALGGEDKHITALFSDVKSFSSFSELVSPVKLVSVLNVYLGKLSDAIMDRRGTIDKYVGDEIVSFFGAPLEVADHAYQACLAGLAMKKAEAQYNTDHVVKLLTAGKNKGMGIENGEERSVYIHEPTGQKFEWTDREFDESEYIPRELESRVGINTGNMVVGNMGTEKKLNYTMMGDNVNLASRIEGVNKMYKSWVLCSEDTWLEADSGENKGKLLARKFDRVRVVGKQQPVQLVNILGFKSELPAECEQSVNLFHKGLELYLQKDFTAAEKTFMEANSIYPSDDASLIFATRCREYIEKGVPADWDGIINMTVK